MSHIHRYCQDPFLCSGQIKWKPDGIFSIDYQRKNDPHDRQVITDTAGDLIQHNPYIKQVHFSTREIPAIRFEKAREY